MTGVVYAQPRTGTDRTWDLTMIAISPALQGAGTGSRLLCRLEKELADRDQRLLTVETSSTPGFAGARSFYARNGYIPSAHVRDYWEDGDDLILFSKRIQSTRPSRSE